MRFADNLARSERFNFLTVNRRFLKLPFFFQQLRAFEQVHLDNERLVQLNESFVPLKMKTYFL